MNLEKQREIIEAFASDCESGDFSKIGRTWSHFFYDLQDARGVFVVGDSKYDRPLLPTDSSFATKCKLVGLLKSRQIGLIKDGRSTRPCNYAGYIFADTNFVSYCNTVYSGKSLGANEDAFYAAGDYLLTKRDSLGAMCYLIENFEQRHHPQVKNSIKAFAAFKFADTETFRNDRKIRPTISEERLDEMATALIASLETSDFKTIYEQMKLHYLTSRIALTKIAAIDFGVDARKSAKNKLLNLFQFFHDEVALLPQIEMFAAWQYYEHKSKEPFFKLIQRNASDLLGGINSMSWDLAHWRNIMTMVTAGGHLGIGAPFPIPYFLTFDQGFASLLRQLQLKGIIFLGSGTRYVAIPDNQNLQSFSDVVEDAEHLMTSAAIADRQHRRPADNANAVHLEQLAQLTSQELAAMVSKSN